MNKDVLLEIGLEELPARFIDDAERQLLDRTSEWLKDHRIDYQSIKSFSTPRRLAVVIKGLAHEQETIVEEVRGPSQKIAQNDDGSWSKAAIGFSKGQGEELDNIFVKDVKGTPYIFVKKVTSGKKTHEVLPDLGSVISSISFPETMYWDYSTIPYSRPIRWIVALYDQEIIPFEVANVQSNRITYGHRFLGESIELNTPASYEQILLDNYVIADAKKREQQIMKEIKQMENKHNFNALITESLLTEVRNLVEYPTVFYGKYNKDFLTLPREILITAMEEHQRYFPVESRKEKLLPYFISVRNGDDYGLSTVIRGNEKVLEARLSDAQFFYDEDQKYSIEHYTSRLKSVIFQDQLGTYDQKIIRMEKITNSLAYKLDDDSEVSSNVLAATKICKFDLLTQMVNEFPELQGIIGEKYALNKGVTDEVATAIREHHLPAKANGPLPKTHVGAILSVADKIDTIVGCFIIGLKPSGSQDPYGLRRQAIGVLRIMYEYKWDISVDEILNLALNEFAVLNDQPNDIKQDLQHFFTLRAQNILKEMNIEHDVSQSVLSTNIGVFHNTVSKAKVLSVKKNDESFKQIEEALVRVINLAKQATTDTIDQSHFQTESEEDLYKCFKTVKGLYVHASQKYDASGALDHLTELAQPIHTFFDHNMVMDDDEQIRTNRLALLSNIAKVINDYADFTVIQWKQQT